MHIIIGVSTYGSLPRVNGFIKSVMSNMEDISPHTLTFVCYDDGTPDQQAVNERIAFCKRYGFKYVRNVENRGISFTWNRIAQYEEADLVGVFNDGVRFLSPGWLTRLIFFFEKNINIGMVSLPTINEMGFDSNGSGWLSTPQRIISPCDRCFAIRPDILFQISNKNEQNGFPEDDLTSSLFYVGQKFTENNFFSYLLPWPPVRYIEETIEQKVIIEQSSKNSDRQIIWLDRDGIERSYPQAR